MGSKCMKSRMPETLTIEGVKYVREDTIPKRQELPRSHTLKELAEATGISYASLLDAVKRGELRAAYPNGTRRGVRVWEADFRTWAESIASPSRS